MIQPIVLVILLNILYGSCITASSKRSYLTQVFRIDHGRDRRDISTEKEGKHESKATFSLKAFNKRWILDVKQNNIIHTPRVLLRSFDVDDKLIQRRHVPKSCYYHGSVRDVANSAVVLDTCGGGLSGYIQDESDEFYIDPVPDSDEGTHEVTKSSKDDPFSSENVIKGCGVKHHSSSDEHIHQEQEDSRFHVHPNETEGQYQKRIGRHLVHLEKQYIPYLTTNNTRYIELFLVSDNMIYQQLKNDTNLVLQRVLAMVNMADRVYSAINVRVVLRGLEVWSNGDRMVRSGSSGADLDSFDNYYQHHIRRLTNVDASHFLSHRGWSGGVIGLAWIPSGCSWRPTAIDLFQTNKVTGTHEVFVHELGHNFNMGHDGGDCKCLSATGGCAMGAGGPCKRCGFSDCSMRGFRGRAWKCIDNYPKSNLVSQCGNGLVENGEECDCGSPEMCKKKDPCCQPYNCILKREAQCSHISTPDCCKNCLFKSPETMCRVSTINGCDVPEYCTGDSSTCPADSYMKDGTPCGNSIQKKNSNCYLGNCVLSRSTQCLNLWSVNVARGKPTKQSSTAWGGSSSRVVDGNTNSQFSARSCSHTATQHGAWWRVDLGQSYPVAKVIITNRGDCCWDRLRNFDIRVGETDNNPDANSLCFRYTGQLGRGETKAVSCNTPSFGRYVFVRLNGNNAILPLCEVEVIHGETRSANETCWKKLNMEAKGYGTCNPRSNQSCAQKDIYCGQLQCFSQDTKPRNNYGSNYHRIDLGGNDHCSVASITMRESDEVGLGMVSEGTKCGPGKMCNSFQCKSLSELNIKDCPKSNGSECAGNGVCTNTGKCHCFGDYDRNSGCQKLLQPRDGGYGSWSLWTACTRPCNKGKKRRHRVCNKPFPEYGGKHCQGQRTEEDDCNIQSCPQSRSCKTLMIALKGEGKHVVDGIYTIYPNGLTPVKTYCDMTRHGGGWTLLVTSHTNKWTSENVLLNNADNPQLLKDFSILKYADDIKDNYRIKDNFFEYRLEAQHLGRYGGIWRAPSIYSFVAKTTNQTGVKLTKKFDKWDYKRYGVQKTMPHIYHARLTTSRDPVRDNYGSITDNNPHIYPAHWMNGYMVFDRPEYIWYWMREGDVELPKSCLEILHRGTNGPWNPTGYYVIKTSSYNNVSTYCDMDSLGGGWTLLLNKVSSKGWTKDNVIQRNIMDASLSSDYSIYGVGNEIKNRIPDEDSFQYMVEANGRLVNGGVFMAPKSVNFLNASPELLKPSLLLRFGNWSTKSNNLVKRVPYVTDKFGIYLTTSSSVHTDTSGSIITKDGSHADYLAELSKPTVIRIWIRETGSRKSCNDIKIHGEHKGISDYKDGVYFVQANGAQIIPVYCDMTSSDSGWTLIVTSISNNWTESQVLSRNEHRPSDNGDYSILHRADKIRDLSHNKTFKYKIEAVERGHWGSIFEAPKYYTFTERSNAQTNVKLLVKFDAAKWTYNKYNTLQQRMPYIGIYQHRKGLLTTSASDSYSWYGTLVSSNTEYHPAPYMDAGPALNPGIIWYWINEDDCGPQRKAVHGKMSQWSMWGHCCKGIQKRTRHIILPRCGGNPALSNETMEEEQKCSNTTYCSGAGSVNIAKGKPTAQSSIAANGEPSRAVDGNTNTHYFRHSCTHTGKQKGAWWRVDLLDHYNVKMVKITNRGDCCWHRLRSFEISVGNNKDDPRANKLCVAVDGALGRSETRTLLCAARLSGRYLFVVNNVDEPLTLCEVQVFGVKACCLK